MYILIKEELEIGKAIVAASHASLACYIKFQDHTDVKTWLSGPFKKAVCKVNIKEFEKAKLLEDNIVLTESSLNNQEVAIAFRPREEWPKPFKFYKLYK